jgi:16S rRNA (uracil1498-N3)-methyltransferase
MSLVNRLPATMHRFYLPPERCAGDALRLDGREAHHALRVLRVKRGELVTVLDGIGNEFMCTVENSARNVVTLSVSLKNFTPPRPAPSRCCKAVPKGKIIEASSRNPSSWARKRIVPLLTERVVTQLDDEGRGKQARQMAAGGD